MCISSLRFTPVFCSNLQEEETSYSHTLRVGMVGIGTITLLVGILTSNLSLNLIGGGLLITPLFIRSVIQGKDNSTQNTNQNSTEELPPVRYPNTQVKTTDLLTGETTKLSQTKCSLKSFLESTAENDIALRATLQNELRIENLSERLKENFPAVNVDLRLLVTFKNDLRNDERLLFSLKLIFWPIASVLALPTDQIKTYEDDQMDLICFRLSRKPQSDTQESEKHAGGTLGEFLSSRQELLADTLPLTLFPLFTKEQMIFFLENKENLDAKLVNALFPFSNARLALSLRSAARIKELDLKLVTKILPFLSGGLVWIAITSKKEQLNYAVITPKQCDEMLPTSFGEKLKTIEKLRRIDVKILNVLLTKMTSQLQLIPSAHLKNPELVLKDLTNKQVQEMFPADLLNKRVSQDRLGQLEIEVLNSILLKMDDTQRELIPLNQLRKIELNLRSLSRRQIERMFPMDLMKKTDSLERKKVLSQENRDYVATFIKIS